MLPFAAVSSDQSRIAVHVQKLWLLSLLHRRQSISSNIESCEHTALLMTFHYIFVYHLDGYNALWTNDTN